MAEACAYFYKNGYEEDEYYKIPFEYRVFVKGAEVIEVAKVGFLHVIAQPKMC
jgi:hypothetical protein